MLWLLVLVLLLIAIAGGLVVSKFLFLVLILVLIVALFAGIGRGSTACGGRLPPAHVSVGGHSPLSALLRYSGTARPKGQHGPQAPEGHRAAAERACDPT